MNGRDQTEPRRILPEHRIDNVANAVIALMRELWVVQDRQVILEKLLADAGIPTAEIDRLQPDPATQQLLEARRDALIDHVIGAMRGTAAVDDG